MKKYATSMCRQLLIILNQVRATTKDARPSFSPFFSGLKNSRNRKYVAGRAYGNKSACFLAFNDVYSNFRSANWDLLLMKGYSGCRRFFSPFLILRRTHAPDTFRQRVEKSSDLQVLQQIPDLQTADARNDRAIVYLVEWFRVTQTFWINDAKYRMMEKKNRTGVACAFVRSNRRKEKGTAS